MSSPGPKTRLGFGFLHAKLLLIASVAACGPQTADESSDSTELGSTASSSVGTSSEETGGCRTVDFLLIQSPADAEDAADVCVATEGVRVAGLGSEVTSLPPLSQLREAGALTIDGTSLENLDFLSELRTIAGPVALLDNPGLTDLTGLASLESVGSYLQSAVPGAPVGDPLVVTAGGLFEHAISLVGIADTAAASTWRSFALTSANNVAVQLASCPIDSLADVQSTLAGAERIILRDLQLVSLDGLESATELEDLFLIDLPALSNVDELGTTSLRALQVVETPALTSLAPIDGAELRNLRLGACSSADNTMLGLPSPTNLRVEQVTAPNLQTLELFEQVSLSSLDLLEHPALTYVAAQNNPDITDADAIQAVTDAEVASSDICGNGGEPECNVGCAPWVL